MVYAFITVAQPTSPASTLRRPGKHRKMVPHTQTQNKILRQRHLPQAIQPEKPQTRWNHSQPSTT
ncbi:MAG: hypothetical protein M1503_08485 [Thaumarchaeota archaeon]|nr:hypothetical protein [Nitrososphaerota archaeon]